MKRPLKVIAAVAFMAALGYGVATNSKVSESGKTGNVNLSSLSSVSAQGETDSSFAVLAYCDYTGTIQGCEEHQWRTCASGVFCPRFP